LARNHTNYPKYYTAIEGKIQEGGGEFV
jgi:hypothetical protein